MILDYEQITFAHHLDQTDIFENKIFGNDSFMTNLDYYIIESLNITRELLNLEQYRTFTQYPYSNYARYMNDLNL